MTATGGQLLIVDDEDGLRASLAASLEMEGHTVVEAKSGLQAITLVQERPFDLVVTDVRMRELDGVETFREIRKLRPAATVILMTGFASEALVGNALAEGAYTVLYKPLAMPHFMNLVARAITCAKVLVLGECPQAQELASALQDIGLQAQWSTDSDRALHLIGEKCVDVCLLDLALLGADGPKLYAEINRLDPTVSIIAINGHKIPSVMHQLMRQGSYTCLRQPLEIRELVHAIARARRDYGRRESS